VFEQIPSDDVNRKKFSLKGGYNENIEILRRNSKILTKNQENYDQDLFYIQDKK